MKQKKYKRCPRCDKKTPFYQDRCDRCSLVFSRLSKASNRAAKVAIKNKEYNKVIMDSVLPKDVHKWKLFLWGLFLGFFGVHFAKVGRYKMFTWAVISAACIYIAAMLPLSWFSTEYLVFLMWGLVLPSSVYFIFYIVSVFQIAFNRFKVPIAIDEEYVKEELDTELVKDILNQVKLENEDNSKKQSNCEKKEQKQKKIKVVCASCGLFVKVSSDEKTCPKCDEPLYDD